MEIEALVETDQMREAWSKIQRCYQQAKGNPIPPTRKLLEHTSTLRDSLYSRIPLEVEAIPIIVQPARIADDTLEGEEITVLVWRLLMGQAGVPLGMREEYLKASIREVTK